MPLITHLVIARYKSTREIEEALSALSQASGLPDHVLSRLAISRSLQVTDPPEMVAGERKGKELRGETFFHSKHDPDYLPWVTAMIAQHLGRPFKNDDEAISFVIGHWHRGVALLSCDIQEYDGRFNDALVALARQASDALADGADDGMGAHAGFSAPTRVGDIRPMTVAIGRLNNESEPVTVTLNDSKRYSNCHVAVSGMSGSGKTQFVKQMLASAFSDVNGNIGIIFIDFAKGDVAADQRFVRAINASVIRLPGDVLPIGPFHLPDYSADTIRLVAEEKREVYTQLFRSLGPKQQGRLATAIRESYEDLVGDAEQAPDFAYVQQKLNDVYLRDAIQPDSLTELLRQLNAYRLFWQRGTDERPVSPIHTQRWIVDIHELGGLKEVTAFTIIEQLYREMRGLTEADIDPESGLRHIRCLLVIDEAQYYLKARNRFLQGIIREGRSKGFAVMLMCQSPDDFDQDDFDYTEQLQFTYMLQCKTEPRAVQRLLGVSRDEAKRLATDLGQMEPLHGVGRLPGAAAGKLSRFRVVPFFEWHA